MTLRASALLREKIPGKKKEVVVPPRLELELTVSKTAFGVLEDSSK